MLKIRELRKAAKLTQTDIAKAAGVTQPAVVAWEKRQTQPHSDRLPVIARALGCEIADLYEEETT